MKEVTLAQGSPIFYRENWTLASFPCWQSFQTHAIKAFEPHSWPYKQIINVRSLLHKSKWSFTLNCNDLLIFTGVVQTLLPSYQNPSTVPFSTSEGLQQSIESTWIIPSSSFSRKLQNITTGKKFTSMFLLLNIAVTNLFIHHARYFWIPILEPMQTSKYFDLKIHILLN